MRLTRRELFGFVASVMVYRANRATAAIHARDFSLLSFLDRLPPESRQFFIDDAKFLVGWVTDAAALGSNLRPGQIVDRSSSFSSVPGFAAPTRIDRLSGRYRVLREAKETHGYYGLLLGFLDASDATRTVVLVNRLFRLPILLQEPIGVATDIFTNAGLLFGFDTAALGAALELADAGDQIARQLGVPLIATGQSQAGGTAQLQVASIAARPGLRCFVTFNATCSPGSIQRLGVDSSRLPGVNFAKDLDPFVGPHTWLANGIGLQIYIHADGSGSFVPGASVVTAALHPTEHFLDSFKDVSLSAVLESLLAM